MSAGLFREGVCLLNIAHQGRRPKHASAAFRLLGCFSNANEAVLAAQTFPTDCDIVMIPLQRWVCLLKDATAQDKEETHLQTLLKKHADSDAQRQEKFRARVEQGAEAESVASPSTTESVTAPTEAAGVGPWPRVLEQRLQSFAVVSILRDLDRPSEEAEPALLCWAVADTEERAKAYITEELSATVTDVHLWVVALYEWLKVPEASELDAVQEHYRDERLNEIMKAKKEGPVQVKRLEAECKDKGVELPVIDLSKPQISVTDCKGPVL
jgi:hypothetical protein